MIEASELAAVEGIWEARLKEDGIGGYRGCRCRESPVTARHAVVIKCTPIISRIIRRRIVDVNAKGPHVH